MGEIRDVMLNVKLQMTSKPYIISKKMSKMKLLRTNQATHFLYYIIVPSNIPLSIQGSIQVYSLWL